ncbi:discoidin domain-containing protein [Streptomyces fungicidicus]|uniref:discoidin domain-containing protein n=1 Tax=Streptomyces fungicidicus TaxID=68203 RepID=UPI00340B0859
MTEQHAPDPGSFAVDLRAVCEVDWIRLAFTADGSDPVFTPPFRDGPHGRPAGRDVRPSYPLEFVVETSTDNAEWTSVYRTAAGTGGVVNIQLTRPVTARWVRMTSHRRSGPHPLGLDGFEVYGDRGRAGIRAVRP